MTKTTINFRDTMAIVNANIMADMAWIDNAHPDHDRMGIAVSNRRIDAMMSIKSIMMSDKIHTSDAINGFWDDFRNA